MKKCSKCGVEKPATLEFFYKNTKIKCGLHSHCKECDRAKGRKWYEKNKERASETNKKYYEENKEKIKEYRENNKEHYAELNKQWRENNKDRLREYNREWLSQNREKERQRLIVWRENNPEHARNLDRKKVNKHRAKKAGVKIIHDVCPSEVLEKWGTDCHICNEPVGDKWDMDHVIPLSHPDCTHTLDNIKPAHPSCNSKKGTKLL